MAAAAVRPNPKAADHRPKERRGSDRASRCRLGSTAVANRGCRARGSLGRRVRGSRREGRRDRLVRAADGQWRIEERMVVLDHGVIDSITVYI